jgi:hypothetical protein
MIDRQFLISYQIKEIEKLFKDRYNCSECPFVQMYKGKIPFGCGDFHRMYCKLKYVFRSGLNFIFNTAYNNQQLDVIINKIRSTNPKESVNNVVPDVVKVHPNNPHLFIVSVLRVKELVACPLDLENEGITTLSSEQKKEFEAWKLKYGIKGITIQDKAIMEAERRQALNARNIN